MKAECFIVAQFECPSCDDIHECAEIPDETDIFICPNTGEEIVIINNYFIDLN